MPQIPLNSKNNLRLSDLTSDAAIVTTDTLLFDKNAIALPAQRARRLLVSEFLTFLLVQITNSIVPTGVAVPWLAGAAPSGWVLLSGGTIGSASSGGTLRANADTQNLFTALWTNFGQTEFPIQTSAGAGSTRGASAAADFAANKRMPVPDLRGRSFFGLDNIGGSAANRITNAGSGIVGTTPGVVGGAESVTLVAANQTDAPNATNNAATGADVKSSVTQAATAVNKMNPAFLGWWIVKL